MPVEIAEIGAPAGFVAVIASARQTNEELLLSQIARRRRATDSVPGPAKRPVAGHADKSAAWARRWGVTAEPMNLPIADGIRRGAIKDAYRVRRDVTRHGLSSDLLSNWTLIVAATPRTGHGVGAFSSLAARRSRAVSPT